MSSSNLNPNFFTWDNTSSLLKKVKKSWSVKSLLIPLLTKISFQPSLLKSKHNAPQLQSVACTPAYCAISLNVPSPLFNCKQLAVNWW